MLDDAAIISLNQAVPGLDIIFEEIQTAKGQSNPEKISGSIIIRYTFF